MTLVALTVDQKDQLKQASKFPAMIRSGAYTKANFWINTVDPGTPASLPGGVGNTAAYERWRKSKGFSTQIFQNPGMPEANSSLINFFISNLTQSVYENGGILYTFNVSLSNASVGATFTNNGQTFTVVSPIAPGTTLICTGTGAPSASGTLTKTGGVGDASIAFSSVSSAPAIPFDANTVILNMEANAPTMIDPAMDATFDSLIKYTP